MSEEEKKAIEYFNDETKSEAMYYGTILLNLIEKQQKEIEELKIVLNAQIKQNEQLKFENKRYTDKLCYVIPPQKDDYISKQKIKDRYEQLKHYDYIETKELIKLLEN